MSDGTKIYQKKLEIVGAIQYIPHENCAEVAEFLGQIHDPRSCREVNGDATWLIETLDGTMAVRPKSWVVKGLDGEFWAIEESIFAKSYEAIEERPFRETQELLDSLEAWAKDGESHMHPTRMAELISMARLELEKAGGLRE